MKTSRSVLVGWVIALVCAASCGSSADSVEPSGSSEPSGPAASAQSAQSVSTERQPVEFSADAMVDVIGPSSDVAADVSRLADFPALPTISDADVVEVGIEVSLSTTQEEIVTVRYRADAATVDVGTFFDDAALAAGWEPLDVPDLGSYGGGSAVYVGLFDRPGVGGRSIDGDAPDVEIVVEEWDGANEVTIRGTRPLGADESTTRIEALVAEIHVPDGGRPDFARLWAAADGDGGVELVTLHARVYDQPAEELISQLLDRFGTASVTSFGDGRDQSIVDATGATADDSLVYGMGPSRPGEPTMLEVTARISPSN